MPGFGAVGRFPIGVVTQVGAASLSPIFQQPWSEGSARARITPTLTAALIATGMAPQVLTLPTIAVSQASPMPVFEWRLLYQSVCMPPPNRPNPNVTGILACFETRDIFFGGALQFIHPVSGEIGLSEATVASIGEIGLAESPAPGTVSIFGGSIGVSKV